MTFTTAESAGRSLPRVLVIESDAHAALGLEDILAAAAPHCRKVVVGPTVGLVPDAFLRRGCSILGGTLVTEPDEFLDILAEGGSGYHFFGKSAQKFVLRASNRKDAHISAWPCLSEAREDAAAPLS